MRGHLVVLAGLGVILASACNSSSSGTSSGTSGGTTAGTTGGGSTGGTTTGGGTTGGTTGASTSGGTTGGLAAGAPCTGNAQCLSDACGTNGSGRCCTAACATSDATCGASACDAAGACVYPATSTTCGTNACSSGDLTTSACDGSGACMAGTPGPCPGNFECADGTSCLTTCNLTADCLAGFYCHLASHQCRAPLATGPCTTNEACTSGFCGIAGTGNCCTAQCAAAADPACNPTSCDATSGACVFPSGNACGTPSCAGATLTAGTCDPVGACNTASGPCPNDLVCNPAGTACLATCAASADCVSGFYCNAGRCSAQVATGPCGTNEACTSGICGIKGVGHCCTAVCDTTDPSCGAKDCDNLGACTFPNNRTACGTPGSCSGSTQTDPTTCDGAGACQAQGTTDCTPFICGATACLTSCKDATSCVSGDFCDVSNTACCSGLANGGTINVDGATGNDSTSCCGIGTNGACLTLTHAMALIDAAQAQNVTINATVKGGGGDWTAKETYPVKLGWGVELSAPGVFFLDPTTPAIGPNVATFDITAVSGSDTVGYASIVGTAKSPISVGMDSTGTQTDDSSTVAVETGNKLYLANASVNGSSDNADSAQAILVQPAATLFLGQDQSGTITGTVTIGNALGQEATDGWAGIVCNADLKNSLGCNVQDAALVGQSAVVIQGQEALAIDAEDFAVISLTSSPVIGPPPAATGFKQCPQKVDAQFGGSGAVVIDGSATVTFNNGTVQCLAGTAFGLMDSLNGIGPPTLNLDHTLIQNTELGILASDGTATVTNSTVNFNNGGVQQATDGTNNGTIDLSGGGNTVVCSSNQETAQFNSNPGISVYNTSTANLAADNVAWDTSGPDHYDCDSLFTSCTCNLGSCTVAAGTDGMDAVEDSTNKGGVTTTTNTLSSITCN